MTQRDDDDDDAGSDEEKRPKKRGEAPKERVLHTRVPAVLEQELKRLARTLRVPVSNVVRTILEDAVDAVDTVSERAEGEILGFAERLARQRNELRTRMRSRREEGDEAEEDEEQPECPDAAPELLDGVFGYQTIVLATETRCGVCGRALGAGAEAHRALFDDPGRRVFLGPECRLLPEKES